MTTKAGRATAATNAAHASQSGGMPDSPGNGMWMHSLREWMGAWREGVVRFFLEPSSAETLALIRMATGAMIVYIHAVWLWDREMFFGPDALVDLETLRAINARSHRWTYLALTDSLGLATAHEWLALLAGASLSIGFATRWVAPLAWFLTLMTVHRLIPFLFGLDQITLMLSMYLIVGRSGSVWSLDAMLARRCTQRGINASWVRWLGWSDDGRPCWSNTVATRLIQLHLCAIYLFGGLGKLRGWMWWDGSALWFAAASYEYQSLDLTWIGRYPWLASAATHATLFWELMYVALVWPRLTRPLVLAMALCVHGGIAIYMGMITFGVMMIVANLAFLSPALVRSWVPSRPNTCHPPI
ncbi:MAG: HTTM domain-containing protein [Pirellula sp.]